MNAQDKGTIPKAHLAEACVWVTRLHGDDRNADLEEGFRQWLKADPLNARAFERTTAAWDDSINLRRVVPFAHDAMGEKNIAPRNWGPRLAWAASILLIVAAAVGYRFYLAGGYTTAVGEQRLLVLKDGTRVFLNTDTRVVDRYSENERRVELESGEALFEVAKEAARPFIVQAGERQVRALGTSFVVRRDAQELAITLVEGKVAVGPSLPSSSSGTEIGEHGSSAVEPAATVLKPGERVTFVRTTRLARIDTPALETVTAWRRGQVVLDDTPLASAVEEMNRYSKTKLVIENPDATHLLVNGLFQAGDSASFANVVSVAFDLKVENTGDTIVLR